MMNNSIDRPGLECPHCGCPGSHVVYTRHRTYRFKGETVSKTIRRRRCEHCGKPFTTSERVEGKCN